MAIGVSNDLISTYETQGVPRGHFVATFEYPYSDDNFDLVTE